MVRAAGGPLRLQRLPGARQPHFLFSPCNGSILSCFCTLASTRSQQDFELLPGSPVSMDSAVPAIVTRFFESCPRNWNHKSLFTANENQQNEFLTLACLLSSNYFMLLKLFGFMKILKIFVFASRGIGVELAHEPPAFV